MIWRFVVRVFGGFYEHGRWAVCVHDAGICFARDQVIRWEWPRR